MAAALPPTRRRRARRPRAPARPPCPRPARSPAPRPSTARWRYWLERARGYGDPDAPLLTPAQVAAQNRALTEDEDNGLPIDWGSLAQAPPIERLRSEVERRLSFLREQVASGEYVDADGERLDADAAAALNDVPLTPDASLHVALSDIPLRCGPRPAGLFKVPVDPDFDRNDCSLARAQEPVQVLMRWPNGMQLARTRYAIGWITGDAPLSPAITGETAAALLGDATVRAPHGTRLTAEDGATRTLDDAAILATDEGEVLFADERGVHRAPVGDLMPTTRPLTRRGVLEEAFARLDRPYGWGGRAGGLDCSRFTMDVLGTFGLEMPRHSSRQADSGTYHIDLKPIEDLDERARLIDAANHRGIVLLHFPGHIMLYLGRDAQGTPMAIHSFSEYVEPCEGGGETLRRVDRVTVSDLTLGRGSSRRSFLERIEDVSILGQTLGPELIGVATPRPAANVILPPARLCDDRLAVRVFHSPRRPSPRQPLRVMVTAVRELGPVQLALIDPDGGRHTPEMHRLGGPPFTYWARARGAGARPVDGGARRRSERGRLRAARRGALSAPARGGRSGGGLGAAPALGGRHRGALQRVRGAALRLPGRRGPHLAQPDRPAPGSVAKPPLRSPLAGRRVAHRAPARLRRSPLLPAHLLRVEDAAALRLPRVLPRATRAAAHVR